MEILLGFLGVLIVLAFLSLPVVNLVLGISARKEIGRLKHIIQRLEIQLNSELKNRRISSGAPGKKEEQPEPKPENLEASRQQKPKALTRPKEVKQPPVIETLKPPPPVPPPDQTQAAEPDLTPEPAEPVVKKVWKKPAKPEPVAASVQAESPLPAKADAESIEMKLGTYWFVRIGVVLVLTGLGTLAYYNKDFFFNLSPVAKVSLFYLLSAALGGVGFWLQRTRETLKNFGHVLIAGGCAGVYFTTYAAHVFQPVYVIPSPTVALLLLFAWGGFMVWFADRIKSETVALFAIGGSYYATCMPLIHSGEVSQWVFLFSNLILSVVAVVFMLRNQWLKIPVLSMVASYAGFFFWRIRIEEDAFLPFVVLFVMGLWVVYTAAVFLSRDESFSDRMRASFLTSNNTSMFCLLMFDVLKLDADKFWILPMAVGIVLLGCVLAAARFLKDQSLSRKSYLTQGLMMVTLGLMTMKMSGSVRGPILGVQSVVLLFMAIRRENFIIRISSFCVAAIAVVYALLYTFRGTPDFLLGGLFTGVILLFNARLCHRHVEAANESMLRLRVSCLTGVGLAVGLIAFVVKASVLASLQDWAPAILLATTVLFTGSVYRLKIREFLLLGQVPAVLGLFLSIPLALSSSGFIWPLFCALVLTLGHAHWWRWQRDQFSRCCSSWVRSTHKSDVSLANKLAAIIEMVFSAGFVLQLLVWLLQGVELEQKWLWLGALVTLGMTLYAVFTRARFIGLFSQVYLLLSCWVMFKLCIEGSDEYASLTLIPIATLYLMNLGIPIAIARIGQVPEMIQSMVGRVQLVYRLIAAALGLLWIHSFVSDEWKVLVFILVGVAFFAVQCLRPGHKWVWVALAYALVGYITFVSEFIAGEAYWKNLLAIAVPFVVQQLGRRENVFKVPDGVHQCLILVGGTLLFTWLSIKVSKVPGMDGHGLRTIVWTILGVGYFGLGLGLKERWYRLMGLGTLAIALVSLVPIIWGMSTKMKIASFFVMGMVFIGLGFVYTRFKEQIKKLL